MRLNKIKTTKIEAEKKEHGKKIAGSHSLCGVVASYYFTLPHVVTRSHSIFALYTEFMTMTRNHSCVMAEHMIVRKKIVAWHVCYCGKWAQSNILLYDSILTLCVRAIDSILSDFEKRQKCIRNNRPVRRLFFTIYRIAIKQVIVVRVLSPDIKCHPQTNNIFIISLDEVEKKQIVVNDKINRNGQIGGSSTDTFQ